MEPLSYRMRPREFAELIGQETVLGQGWLLKAVREKNPPSLVFVGPPGVGKTSLSLLVAEKTGLPYKTFSAVTSTIKEIKQYIEEIYGRFQENGIPTMLFIDEIHRFNKAQQDALLPWIEKGVIILLGTTTENPSFYITAPLLSRVKVVRLAPLSDEALLAILKRALGDGELAGKQALPGDDVLRAIAEFANFDARAALNALELVANNWTDGMTVDNAMKILADSATAYDKKGDFHYNLISAFIKSLRGSDPDAAVYYLARMLEAGEDPYFILRRMVIFASEDIGNADPHALMVATSAHYAFDVVGMPEGFIPLSHAVTYLSLSPKSNASYKAYLAAKEDVARLGPLSPPLAILNPVTKLMKEAGYGAGYKYPHDFAGSVAPGMTYLPDKLRDKRYYAPRQTGHEKVLAERLARLKGES